MQAIVDLDGDGVPRVTLNSYGRSGASDRTLAYNLIGDLKASEGLFPRVTSLENAERRP